MKYINQQSIEIPVMVCKQPIGEFYIGVMQYEDLRYITYVDVQRLEHKDEMREVEIYTGIQRELEPSRVKEIGKYVNLMDATFPTSVILHIDTDKILDFDKDKKVLTIKYEDNVAKVLDGQHRIAGLGNFTGENFDINVTIFFNMELEDQGIVFATINKTQTKVPASRVYEIYEFATKRSPQKTAHNIVRALNIKNGSPFQGRIKILGTAIDRLKETITQATFADSIVKLVSKDPMDDRNEYKLNRIPEMYEGKLIEKYPLRKLFVSEKDEKIAMLIFNYFAVISAIWSDAWNNNQIKNGLILNKSTGLLAFMDLFRDIYNAENRPDEISYEKYYEYLKKSTLRSNDFNTTEFLPGGTGKSNLYQRLKSDIFV